MRGCIWRDRKPWDFIMFVLCGLLLTRRLAAAMCFRYEKPTPEGNNGRGLRPPPEGREGGAYGTCVWGEKGRGGGGGLLGEEMHQTGAGARQIKKIVPLVNASTQQLHAALSPHGIHSLSERTFRPWALSRSRFLGTRSPPAACGCMRVISSAGAAGA